MTHPPLLRPLLAVLLLSSLSASVGAAAPVPVRAQPASTLLQPSLQSASAVVLAPNDAVIAAELSAPVARLGVDVGARVRRGELLVELDCADARLAQAQAAAQVDAARARVALVEQRVRRAETLAERNFVSSDELLALTTEQRAAEAEVKVVDAQRAIAARQVDKCRITAPFDAVVVERHAQVGALAAPGTPLVRIVDLAAPEVEARIPAADAASLEAGQAIEFDSQGRRYALALARISDVIEPGTRSRIARLRFVGEAAPAGAAGSLHWRAPGGRLPTDVLVQRDGQMGVFVADNGVARFVALEGALPGRPADLPRPPSAPIVTAGQQGLQDGMAVVIDGVEAR